jgi:hypothetical protein
MPPTPRFAPIAAGLALTVAAVTSGSQAPAQVAIRFDNSGAERGITVPGTREFVLMGSAWSGGVVATERRTPLYASGQFSYEVGAGGATVTVDTPVAEVTLFYVHGLGFAAGSATAFDPAGAMVEMAASRPATVFADPGNFVTLRGAPTIARVAFSAGVIDGFTFTAAGVPPDTPTPTPLPPVACPGDCNGDRVVSIDEPIRGVALVLGTGAEACAGLDRDGDGVIGIDDLIAGVNAALSGCGA